MAQRIEAPSARSRSDELHHRIRALVRTAPHAPGAPAQPSEHQKTARYAVGLIASSRRDGAGSERTSGRICTEGDLFAAAALHRLYEVNPHAAAVFEATFGEALGNTRLTHGEALPAKAADRILRALIRTGALSREEYRTVERIATAAAHLDSDRTRIGTTRKMSGGIEVSFERAVGTLERNLAAVETHEPHLRTLSLPTTPSRRGHRAAGAIPAGFLWKPISDSTGTLAVLLPPGMTGAAVSCALLYPDGAKVLARGRDGGVGNGGRQHFRFDRPGAEYPAGVIVAITMRDGSVHQTRIDRPAARIEGRGG